MEDMNHCIYALDLEIEEITAAVFCPDERTAKQALRIVSRKMKKDHGMDGFRFGYRKIASRTDGCADLAIEPSVEIPCGLPSDGDFRKKRFDLADFEEAEQHTANILLKNILPDCQRDILFMHFVNFALDKKPLPEIENTGNSEPTPQDSKFKKTTRKRVDIEKIQKAVKLVVDENMTQSDAEKECGLPQATLSRGKGGSVLSKYIRMTRKSPVDKEIGDDFRFNEKG